MARSDEINPGTSSPGRLRHRLAFLKNLGRTFHVGVTAVGVGLVLLAVAFAGVLALEAAPAIHQFGLGFLTGQSWDYSHAVFGALPAIVGTLLTSGLALLFAVPVALGVAIFSAELAPRWLKGPLTYLVDLGAAIPSIVYGFWALIVLVPLMRTQVEPTLALMTGGAFPFSRQPLGVDVLTASLVLAIMITPTIAALSREALQLVPRVHREAALGVGATRLEATRIAVLRPARAGIVGAIMLGFGRAIGETIAVTLVIGNIYILPTSLFSQGQTIPSLIVSLFGSSTGIALSALIELGLILFAMSLAVNLVARILIRRMEEGRPLLGRSRRFHRTAASHPKHLHPRPEGSGLGVPAWWARVIQGRDRRLRRRRVVYWVVAGVLGACVVVAVLPLASLVDTAVTQGGTAVIHPSFYTSEPPPVCLGNQPANCTLGGIGPAIQGTLILLGIAAAIAMPVGILGGIYLAEYGRNRFGQLAGLLVDAMAGVPSILIGVFVFALFLRYDRLDATSAIAGAAALSVLMLPIVTRATTSALQTVPMEVREAALALGFPRHRVTLRVVLGSCRSAVVTGNLLALGRAGGETAALILTAGTSSYWFAGLHSPTAALAPFIYNALINTDAPNYVTDAWGAALVLLLIMVVISLAARLSLRGSSAAELV